MSGLIVTAAWAHVQVVADGKAMGRRLNRGDELPENLAPGELDRLTRAGCVGTEIPPDFAANRIVVDPNWPNRPRLIR